MKRTMLRMRSAGAVRSAGLFGSSAYQAKALSSPLLTRSRFLLSRRHAGTSISATPASSRAVKPDQPHPSWDNYAVVLNNFMEKLIHKERLGYKWWLDPTPVQQNDSAYHHWFDEEKFPEGKTVVSMASFAPDKVQRTLTINWKTWEMTIEQTDSDGILTTSRTIQIPPDWLLAMKKVRWPLPEEAKQNAKASVPADLQSVTVQDKDLYTLVKSLTKDEKELQLLRSRLTSIYA